MGVSQRPLGTDERAPVRAQLRSMAVLARCSDDDLAAAAEFVDEGRVPAGNCFARAGTERETFLIVSGRARLSVPGSAPVLVGRGAVLGAPTGALGVTASAETPVVLLVLRERALRLLLETPAGFDIRLALAVPELQPGVRPGEGPDGGIEP